MRPAAKKRNFIASVVAQLTGVALATLCLATNAADLQVLTEENPPGSFTKDGKVTGLGSEVVDEIQHRLGCEVPVEMYPWARAYKLLQEKPNVALYLTVRTAEREALFKWVGPVTTLNIAFYSKATTPFPIANLAAAKSAAAILVPHEHWSHQLLWKDGFTNLMETATPDTMVKMLLSGRAPLMLFENTSLDFLLINNGASKPDVALMYVFMESQSYIAFSRGTPDKLVQKWQNSLDEMKRDGTFARLYEKWLPGETPPGLKPNPAYIAR
jgi:polar amino acid transport system substrate-binding protein